jgi:hypothetical protein
VGKVRSPYLLSPWLSGSPFLHIRDERTVISRMPVPYIHASARRKLLDRILSSSDAKTEIDVKGVSLAQPSLAIVAGRSATGLQSREN